ncbi:MAG: hypothetical protein WCD53_09945 [Microcoleus sp.]
MKFKESSQKVDRHLRTQNRTQMRFVTSPAYRANRPTFLAPYN